MAFRPSHKPRKRQKFQDGVQLSPTGAGSGALIADPETKTQEPAFPLAAFLWPAKGGTSQWVILPIALMIVGLFRWALGFWNYSGYQSPPMHGDFEAQRHWMVITNHLPISQWYFHDLEWWGLDYPPLTAYHSWLLGKIGSSINPSWFALYTSRGLDDIDLKLYMRATVLVSEYLVYIPAVVMFVRRSSRQQQVNSWEASIALVATLMQPGTMLIDNAHFQYNTVMLGFVVATMSSILTESLLWSCFFFVAALSFKQMALYYAPAVFAYLLGKCLFPQIRVWRFILIAISTALSFGVLLLPLLLGAIYDSQNGTDLGLLPPPPLLTSLPIKIDHNSWYYPILLQLTQCVHRVFPFARGLFEDKVANFWCALHTFHKLHRYPTAMLQKVSLAATLSAISLPCLLIFRYPERARAPLALAGCAWGFFLFSFQVHEKSVLLPLLPMTLLLAGNGGLLPRTRGWVAFANMLGSWTMFPLLKRDELQEPYFVLTLLWGWLIGVPSSMLTASRPGSLSLFEKLVHGCFYLAMIAWHVGEAFVPPPAGKPDTWVVLNVLIGAPGFGICYLWCLWTLYQHLPLSKPRTVSTSATRTEGKIKVR